MKSIYNHLKRGPLLVGEVRGVKSEIGKRFDKSDKNAPPIEFGVLKLNLEILADGTPVVISIYPDTGVNVDEWLQSLDLKRGVVIAASVGRMEFKDGQRKVTARMDGIHVLPAEEIEKLKAA
jgi:hypothetical protein